MVLLQLINHLINRYIPSNWLSVKSEFEFFKKHQNLTSPQGELNLNFLKKSRVQVNLKLNEKKSYDYLFKITYMKKLTVDQLLEVRVPVSFVECLEILWKT